VYVCVCTCVCVWDDTCRRKMREDPVEYANRRAFRDRYIHTCDKTQSYYKGSDSLYIYLYVWHDSFVKNERRPCGICQPSRYYSSFANIFFIWLIICHEYIVHLSDDTHTHMVSFAKEPYKRDCILQKRLVICRMYYPSGWLSVTNILFIRQMTSIFVTEE